VHLRVPPDSTRHRTEAGSPANLHRPPPAGTRARFPVHIAGKGALVRKVVIRATLPAIFTGNRAVARTPALSAELPAIARRPRAPATARQSRAPAVARRPPCAQARAEHPVRRQPPGDRARRQTPRTARGQDASSSPRIRLASQPSGAWRGQGRSV